MEGPPSVAGLLDGLGIPPALFWGFVGLLLFMVGDGVESGYLSTYLGEVGFAPGAVASMFTAYCLAAALGGWLSGALSDARIFVFMPVFLSARSASRKRNGCRCSAPCSCRTSFST